MNTIIEKIRAEVNRLKKANAKLGHTNDIERYEESAYDNACDTILSRLSDLEKEEKPTIQEQPVNEEIEKKKMSCPYHHKGACSAYEYYSVPCDGNCKQIKG